MPERIGQSRRRPDLPIQHRSVGIVVPRGLKVPNVTLSLPETAEGLGQRRPVSLFCRAAYCLKKDRPRVRRLSFSARLVASREQLLESLAHLP